MRLLQYRISEHSVSGLTLHCTIVKVTASLNITLQWQPLQYSCLEKSHGQRSLVGCSPWGREKSDMTERLHFHFSLSCIGEGNGNPFQCSCLENPRDGRAWWATIYGVAQSQSDTTEATQQQQQQPGNHLTQHDFQPCFSFPHPLCFEFFHASIV